VRFPLFRRTIDSVDLTAAAILGTAAFFVVAFFWQASAGAARSDLSLRKELEAEARKRVDRERKQIGHLLALVDAGNEAQAQMTAEEDAGRFAKNSQFHLLLARLSRESGELESSLSAYRRALETNRDYSDRRSEFYLGEELRPLLQEARSAYLPAGRSAGGPVRDIFFIERSLAGGCH